ncbi:mitochondrial carrier [Zopfia rhizophila CBS 207.26]|uniref:Mitochondrial carrier n=1 Tax=Zopfia rhizophila CBS 207.26 TaxID=1314779 RepID=A0A6A6DY59_9PEZI|nr:mitochondrial carrier [Zopfia rhizophila CBS 207.26]
MISIIKKNTKLLCSGAAASMAACFTHPLDQTKYRMQILSSRVSLVRTVHSFAVRDGFLSLWEGLSASILRQSTYSTTRFALYDLFSRKVTSISHSSTSGPSPPATIACAGLAGGMAGLVGNPAEVVLVRMCADGAKPPSERFAYRNALSALIRVGREDGVRAYFRGLGPNVVRSVLMNVSQITTYTEAKRQLMKQLRLEDSIGTHVFASFVAGTVATTVCAPADVLKSRFQNASNTESGKRTSIMRYIVETTRREGPGFLMKGWTPAWLRLAPNTVLTFVFMEKLKAIFVR